MKPRTPIPRLSKKKLAAANGKPIYSTIASPRKAVRKSKRSKSERERIYGPKGYVEWVHERPCSACGVVGYSECAHIKTGGMGRKDDWTQTLPLCGPHVNPGKKTITIGCHKMYDLKILALPAHCPASLLVMDSQEAWREHLR